MARRRKKTDHCEAAVFTLFERSIGIPRIGIPVECFGAGTNRLPSSQLIAGIHCHDRAT